MRDWSSEERSLARGSRFRNDQKNQASVCKQGCAPRREKRERKSPPAWGAGVSGGEGGKEHPEALASSCRLVPFGGDSGASCLAETGPGGLPALSCPHPATRRKHGSFLTVQKRSLCTAQGGDPKTQRFGPSVQTGGHFRQGEGQAQSRRKN